MILRSFGQVLECLDNENLEHLAMRERLLGPLPQHMPSCWEIFQEECTLGLARGCKLQGKYEAIWKLPRLESQNSTFKCFSGILFCLLHIGSLPTQPSDPTTDIATTTTTTFENPKKNFKTEAKTPGVVARLMGLDSLPDPRKVFRRKEDQKEKSGVSMFRLMGLDGLPPQQPLHRQHKGFSETYRQWTASISSQRDGKSYEHRSNWKDSMAQEECMDEYDVLETSKKILSKMGEGTFGQVWECLDNENLEHLAMMERLLGPLPQHMIISADLRAEKYFKRSARLDWLEGASSKESTRAVWKLPRLQLSSQRNGKLYELRSNRKDSMAQQECKDEYEVLETSKVERSSYPAKRTVNSKLSKAKMAFIQQKFMADHGTFGQVLECLDNENLEHLAMMERLLGPLPQHMIISAE
ncbi:unnamed protein product [Camellia sinensis]